MSPLASPKYAFKEALIHGTPAEPGIYLLYFGTTLLYVGIAKGASRHDTLRGRLLAHFHGELKPDVATDYRWEINSDPELRLTELLELLPSRPPYNLRR